MLRCVHCGCQGSEKSAMNSRLAGIVSRSMVSQRDIPQS
eukprot:IDg16124t1